jgi:7-carboxy-7-deazaguanine synthase
MSIDDVVAVVDSHDCPLVEITGGEPLLQDDVYPLMDRLLTAGRTVMLETGGHRSIARVPDAVLKIVDVKCPGSGEADKNDWDNLDRLGPHDQVKFVIKDRGDYEFARDAAPRPGRQTAAVLFSPVRRLESSSSPPDSRGSVDRPPAAPDTWCAGLSQGVYC